MRSPWLASVVFTVVLLATACSAPAEVEAPPDNTVAIELQLVSAQGAGVDELQLRILEDALAHGEVTYEQLATLYEAAKECLSDAGFSTTSTTRTEMMPGTDLWIPEYLANQPAGMSDSSAQIIMTECFTNYVAYAASAYMDQPVNLEKYNSAWDTPAVRECLAERGYLIDPDATGTELNALASEDSINNTGIDGWVPCSP